MTLKNNTDLKFKCELICNGVKLSNRAETRLKSKNTPFIDTTYYTTTSGIPLQCFGEKVFWVNTPLSKKSHLILDYFEDKFQIIFPKKKLRVEPTPLPNYYNKKDSKGREYNDIMSTQTDRVNIFPIIGCSYGCQFCPIPYTEKYETTYDVEDYVESIKVALNDPILPAKHIQITGGVPKLNDFQYFQKIIEGISENFPNVPVDLMMVPKKGLLNFEKFKKAGLNGISLNIEIFNREIAKKLTYSKATDIGIDRYLNSIEEAVNVFGKGNVRSILLVGLEPLEDTLKGVEEIAKRGADPVLSPFVPDDKTPLKYFEKPSVELLEKAFLESKKITDKYGVKLAPRCPPCQHNVLAIPY